MAVGLGSDTHTDGEFAGAAGAMAVCKTGFWTCVDLTDCMMIGECVFVCHVLRDWETATGRCMGCGDIDDDVADTLLIGLGEPAEVAE